MFPFVSVGATETAMTAAVLAKGTTRIVNAAREPEISDLGNCLIAMGAEIWGLEFQRDHHPGCGEAARRRPQVMPDRIEAGTYAIAVAIAGGEVELVGALPETIASLTAADRAAPPSPPRRGLKVAMNEAVRTPAMSPLRPIRASPPTCRPRSPGADGREQRRNACR
ncbi:MAG: hypothetical protein U1E93_11665 [Alphaproteobacteria bacterium]